MALWELACYRQKRNPSYLDAFLRVHVRWFDKSCLAKNAIIRRGLDSFCEREPCLYRIPNISFTNPNIVEAISKEPHKCYRVLGICPDSNFAICASIFCHVVHHVFYCCGNFQFQQGYFQWLLLETEPTLWLSQRFPLWNWPLICGGELHSISFMSICLNKYPSCTHF